MGIYAEKKNHLIRLFLIFFICFIVCHLRPANAQTGSISGAVHESDGTTPIADMDVYVYSDACMEILIGSAVTNASGAYSITDLPEGSVYVLANPTICINPGDPPPPVFRPSNTDYSSQWYGGAISCNEAAPVTVTNGGNTPSIDFQLDASGSVSGIVYDPDGLPAENIGVFAYSDPCYEDSFWMNCVLTDVNGEYSLTGVSAGNLYILVATDLYITLPYDDPNYIREWYNGATDCNSASVVAVSAGANTPGIDFHLNTGGIISGTVTDSDSGTPIENATLAVSPDQCSKEISFSWSDASGNYAVNGLPTGNFYIRAIEPGRSTPEYIGEWYDDVQSCADADAVAVTAELTTANINFQLDEDTDGDGMSDEWEETYFTDLSRDGTLDFDDDGLIDRDEFLIGTYPNDQDSDDDGFSDGDEVNVYNSDPKDPDSHPQRTVSWILLMLLN